ncbi:hypothetical protein ACFL96_14250 [Thermoproteota archaeon]
MKYKRSPITAIRKLISAPFIYVMIIPLLLLDIGLEVYHSICFRLYGLSLIDRWDYIKVDRYKLSYLGPMDKINCAYCGYANGLLNYANAIVAQTEKYWCGVKHKKTKGFKESAHHKDFVPYGDEKAFRRRYIRER